MQLVRVICVKWGDKYGPRWVYNLKNMVKRNLTVPHEFVCMTDQPMPDIKCYRCEPNLQTWWNKIALFKPGKFPGVNLYLDLDVVITANIDALLGELTPGKVAAPDDFSYSLVNPKHGIGEHTRKLLGGEGTINSSVMVWQDDAGTDVWNRFTAAKTQEVHGDQNWITQALWPDQLSLLSPGLVCSYKYHIMRGEKAAPVVVFHGDPKVTQLPRSDPLRLAWAV